MTARPYAMPASLVDHYREVLVTHTSGNAPGTCTVCLVPTCPAWVDAYDRLAAAGLPMGEPYLWDRSPKSGSRPR
jgi:hypothetical protein